MEAPAAEGPAALRTGRQLPDRVVGPLDARRIAAYAQASGDHNPIHLDAAIAGRLGLARPAAHGMLLVALMEATVAEWLAPATVIGLSTRFLAPVLAGDHVTLSGRIVKVSGTGADVTAIVRVFLRNGEGQPACVGEAEVLAGRAAEPCP